MDYDVIVIGGGVTGTAIAWYLARYDIKVLLLEKEYELCEGASKANSGIAHSGYDPEPGTLKASLNVRGSRMLHSLASLLDLDYMQNGAMVLAFSDSDLKKLEKLKERGSANGVSYSEMLSKDEVLRRERNVSKDVKAALFFPTSAIICPFSLVYAFAENAAVNGVEVRTSAPVTGIEKRRDGFVIHSDDLSFASRSVVNAAGIYADRISAMVVPEYFSLTPRRGEYVLLDKTEGFVTSTLFRTPAELGKGVLVTPTVHGNILVGPDCIETGEKDNTATVSQGLAAVMESGRKSVPELNYRTIITSFSGVRAHPDGNDFIIDMPCPGFFNAAGIESPGLTASPAIGEMVGGMVAEYLKAKKKNNYIETRKRIVRASSLAPEKLNELIASNPGYGRIVCRCESVSEGEIVEAVRRGAVTLDGVKRRVRAGMGRCQGGFCTPLLLDILSRELNVKKERLGKKGPGSEVLV